MLTAVNEVFVRKSCMVSWLHYKMNKVADKKVTESECATFIT